MHPSPKAVKTVAALCAPHNSLGDLVYSQVSYQSYPSKTYTPKPGAVELITLPRTYHTSPIEVNRKEATSNRLISPPESRNGRGCHEGYNILRCPTTL